MTEGPQPYSEDEVREVFLDHVWSSPATGLASTGKGIVDTGLPSFQFTR